MADYRAFFVTDIHASDRCFRKFLNAARFYDCKVLIMGGDMTGKMLVPIVDHGGGRWSTRVFGRYRELDQAELPGVRVGAVGGRGGTAATDGGCSRGGAAGAGHVVGSGVGSRREATLDVRAKAAVRARKAAKSHAGRAQEK